MMSIFSVFALNDKRTHVETPLKQYPRRLVAGVQVDSHENKCNIIVVISKSHSHVKNASA